MRFISGAPAARLRDLNHSVGCKIMTMLPPLLPLLPLFLLSLHMLPSMRTLTVAAPAPQTSLSHGKDSNLTHGMRFYRAIFAMVSMKRSSKVDDAAFAKRALGSAGRRLSHILCDLLFSDRAERSLCSYLNSSHYIKLEHKLSIAISLAECLRIVHGTGHAFGKLSARDVLVWEGLDAKPYALLDRAPTLNASSQDDVSSYGAILLQLLHADAFKGERTPVFTFQAVDPVAKGFRDFALLAIDCARNPDGFAASDIIETLSQVENQLQQHRCTLVDGLIVGKLLGSDGDITDFYDVSEYGMSVELRVPRPGSEVAFQRLIDHFDRIIALVATATPFVLYLFRVPSLRSMSRCLMGSLQKLSSTNLNPISASFIPSYDLLLFTCRTIGSQWPLRLPGPCILCITPASSMVVSTQPLL
jgi:hypothetical protein